MAELAYILVNHENKLSFGDFEFADVPFGIRIGVLKNKIKKRKNTLKHVDIAEIEVWNAKVPEDIPLKQWRRWQTLNVRHTACTSAIANAS